MLWPEASGKVVAMRLVRTVVLAACLAGLLLACAAAPAGAQSAPTLVAVRAGRHAGFDRVVFEFRGPVPAARRVRYVGELVQDGSGEPVPLAGGASLEVVFQGANAHDDQGRPTVSPRRFSPGFTALKEVARTGGGVLPFTGPRGRDQLVTGLALLATGATVLTLARRTRTA
jgi:hypothetical protein